MKPANPEFTYQQQQAFILIELISQWEGHLTTTQLKQHFNISRSTASKLIGQYLQHAPNTLRYNAQKKSYQPTATFVPIFSACTLEAYSQFCLGQEKSHRYLCTISTDSPRFFSGLQRPANPKVVRPIIQAMQQGKRVDIAYASLSSPDFAERIISPHSLVFDGYRWHVRAFCEKNNDFRDFVLARINQVFDQEGRANKSQQDDAAWHHQLMLTIEPDPRLDAARQKIIALDYAMEKSAEGRWQKHYQTTEAMLIYWLQYLRIDSQRNTPEAQQIILTNDSRKALVSYLPKY